MEHNHHYHQQMNQASRAAGIEHGQEQNGYDKHAGHSLENFKRKFYISLILTVPVLLLSPFIQGLLNISIKFSGDSLVLFLISSFIFFYGGSPFLAGAVNEIKYKDLGMMTLI